MDSLLPGAFEVAISFHAPSIRGSLLRPNGGASPSVPSAASVEPNANKGPLPAELAARFAPIVKRTAMRWARRLPRHIGIDDLVGAGFVGLIEAYGRYEPTRGSFDAYAEARIRGAMLDEMRSRDPLSRVARAFVSRAARATQVLEARHGRAPSHAELAEEMGLTLAEYQAHATRAASHATSSLDDHDGEAPNEVRDASAVPADERLEREVELRALGDALAALPERLRRIVSLYYQDERTLRDIGVLLGVTESRVCQLHADAIRRLRAFHAEAEAEAA